MLNRQIALTLMLAAALSAAQRFDMKVRNDFFAGFAGDTAALARGMAAAEESIAEGGADKPEAMSWHGSGLLYLSSRKFQQGEGAEGMKLWAEGNGEMDRAGELAPDSIAVLIQNAATWFAVARFTPAEQGRPLLEKGVANYEKVYDIQKTYFDKLGDHPRGELLFGLADAYARLGNTEKAKAWFTKLAAMGSGSGHQDQAKLYLATGHYEVKGIGCVGCHTAKTAGNL